MSFPFASPWLLFLMITAMGAMTGSFLSVVLFAVRASLRRRASVQRGDAHDGQSAATPPHPVSSAHNAPRLPVT